MKNKGFTLTEMLLAFFIVSLLSVVGIVSVNAILKRINQKYYTDLESSLLVSGSNYYVDNRGERPIDDYSFVGLDILEDEGFIEALTDADGNKCSSDSGVYIYSSDGNNYEYEVCLVCGDFQSTGPLCSGDKPGVITISASYKKIDGVIDIYNATLSFANAKWINALEGVNVNFSTTASTKKFIVYNEKNSKAVKECSTTTGSCTVNIVDSGQYYVIGYGENGSVVGNKKSFVIKNDNAAPSYNFENTDKEFVMTNCDSFSYTNKVINIYDNYGVSTIKYMLINQSEYETIKGNSNDIINRLNIEGKELVNNQTINQKLGSGLYTLVVVALDYAGNHKIEAIENIYVRYKVNMVFVDSSNNWINAGSVYVYKGQKYLDTLPGFVGDKPARWYEDEARKNRITIDTEVTKNCTHTVYGKEAPEGTIEVPTASWCNNITYDGNTHQLISSRQGVSFTGNSGKKAGTYNITISLQSGYDWDDAGGNEVPDNVVLKCSIKKRSTTCTSDSGTWTYDGQEHSKPTNGNCTNLVSGEVATFNNSGVITNAGSVKNDIVSIAINAGTDSVINNYDITRVNGDLIVNKRAVTIKAVNQSKTYDCVVLNASETGSYKCVDTGTTDTTKVVTGQNITCTSSGSQTSYGSSVKTLDTVNIIASDGSTYVTDNYEITKQNATLSISKRTITVKADDQQKVYDGSALTADTTCSIASTSANDLVCSHKLVCNNSGSITNVGETTKVLSSVVVNPSTGTTDISNNYTITKENGLLKVTNASFTNVGVSISGITIEGETLTATPSSTPEATSYTYQWWTSDSAAATSGTNISGATNATFVITTSEVGKYIGVTVTASKANYTNMSASDITSSLIAPLQKYNIVYTCNGGTCNGSTEGTINYNVQIANPTKTFVITIVDKSSGATISANSVSEAQTFNGWTSSSLIGLNSAALTGTTTNPTTLWDGSLTKNTYFKNLGNPDAVVIMGANWQTTTANLPTITKSDVVCGFTTTETGTSIEYASGGSYTTDATTDGVTLYGICPDDNKPEVTFNPDGNSDYTKSNTTVTVTVRDEGGAVLKGQSIKYRWQKETTCSTKSSDYSLTVALSNTSTNMESATASVIASGLTGKYYLCIFSGIKDVSSNESEITRSSEFKLDNTKPTITLPSNPLYVLKGSLNNFVNYATATDDDSGIDTFTANYTNASSMNHGSYTLTYTAKDKAGNTQTGSVTLIVYTKINCGMTDMYYDSTDNSRCIFRGSDPNNYVLFNADYNNLTPVSGTGTKYRIIAKEADGTLKIVSAQRIAKMAIHNKESYTWSESTLKTYLNDTYYGTFNSIAKNHMQSHKFDVNMVNHYGTESVTIKETANAERAGSGLNQKIGLPNIYDHVLASTSCDANSTWGNIKSKVCEANNWMVYSTSAVEEWLITSYSEKRSRRWLSAACAPNNCEGTYEGSIQWSNPIKEKDIRPVLYLKETVIIIGGTGTKTDPYILHPTKFISADSPATCTITTPSGYAEEKTLTLTISDNGVAMDTNPVSWTSEISGYGKTYTKKVTTAGNYWGYIKDAEGRTNRCTITINTKTQYQHKTCKPENCKTCPYCSSGTRYYTGGIYFCCYGSAPYDDKMTCEDHVKWWATGLSKCCDSGSVASSGRSCGYCGCDEWTPSDGTWYDESCNTASCKNTDSRTLIGP